jgi:hypothetical protein
MVGIRMGIGGSGVTVDGIEVGVLGIGVGKDGIWVSEPHAVTVTNITIIAAIRHDRFIISTSSHFECFLRQRFE